MEKLHGTVPPAADFPHGGPGGRFRAAERPRKAGAQGGFLPETGDRGALWWYNDARAAGWREWKRV